jgi:hypothetical protein
VSLTTGREAGIDGMGFVGTMAAGGEVGLMRQGGQRRDQVPRVRLAHFSQIGPRNVVRRVGVPGSFNADYTTSPLGTSSGSQTS